MEKLEFYEKLKHALESDRFKEMLLSRNIHSPKIGRLVLERSLYFLISTRDFDNFDYFIERIGNEIFPYQYLKIKKGLSEEASQKLIYENFIRNGFLFHITRNTNVNQILETGLLTLNDKYHCDVYQRCLELDRIYQGLKEKNKDLKDILTLPRLINIPGRDTFTEERFNTVYLSSSLSYALDTYGEIGEFSGSLIDDLFYAFDGCYGIVETEKDKQKEKILEAIQKNGLDITEEEITFIEDFIDTFAEKKKEDEYEKAILMIPNQQLKNPDHTFNMLYKENRLNLSVDTILELKNGEIEHQGSIPPEHIIAITPEKDSTFKVKIKTM